MDPPVSVVAPRRAIDEVAPPVPLEIIITLQSGQYENARKRLVMLQEATRSELGVPDKVTSSRST